MTTIVLRRSPLAPLLVVALAAALSVGVGACAHGVPTEAVTVRVDCNVADASVWVDDLLAGSVSEWSGGGHHIRPGFHRVEIRHPGYYSFFQEIDLPPGGQTVVTARLRELLD
jgi:hypothetical protein